jgi:hypothetical protein
MGEILGLGVTHYPRLLGTDENMADRLHWTLNDPAIPVEMKEISGWPAQMQEEYGDDRGKTSAARHRANLVQGFEQVRQALDEFSPDLLIIWGDDQYENFKEDVIPPFCVLAYDDLDVQPWMRKKGGSSARGIGGKPNVWGEGEDTTIRVGGHKEAAKYLTAGLLAEGFDIAYAYTPLHYEGLSHAFLNAILFLDYHRKGFPHPVVCFPVNCYGRKVIAQRGGAGRFADSRSGKDLDPPSPPPDRFIDLGAATARVMSQSPWRVALMASSSWSHAFLVDKTWRLYPDIKSDRQYYEALKTGDYAKWRNVSLTSIEESGQQEMLNWFCLVGAMAELDRKPTWSNFVETYVFNSSKCFAVFKP